MEIKSCESFYLKCRKNTLTETFPFRILLSNKNSWKTFEYKKSYYTLSASKRSVILLKQLKVKQNFPES